MKTNANGVCTQERIEGATKIGWYWAILEEAERPKDEGIKSRRYVKADR